VAEAVGPLGQRVVWSSEVSVDEEAFLRAISAAPDDGTVRLVYADWLEEHGDPRAEFVRLQVRLWEMPADDPARPQLQAREQQLRSDCPAYWLAKLDPPEWCAVGNVVDSRPAAAGDVPQRVKWYRDPAGSVLRTAALITCLPFIAYFVLWKLPQVICESCRAVRLFIPLSAVYYPAAAALGVRWLGLSGVDAGVLVVISAAGFLHSVPAGPVAFLLSGRKRRASLAAIRYHERLGGIACYQHTKVVAIEPERSVAAVGLGNGRGIAALRYTVSADGRCVKRTDEDPPNSLASTRA
jgi:uncharacterized protein (TIGR02996 family)